jgi:hypothetical protein
VYLPTKAQSLLPFVADELEAIHAMVTFGDPDSVKLFSVENYLETALANRGSLEGLVAEFCASEGIPYLSATPMLDTLAVEGRLGYLSADTHWNDVGQRSLVLPIAAKLKELGVH